MTPLATRGVLWLLGATFMFASMDAISKFLALSLYPVIASTWIRYLVPSAILFVMLFRQRGLRFAHAPQPMIQILRGVFLVGSTLCFWTALRYLPLVEAVLVAFIGPAIITVLSALLLKERPARIHIVALIIGFIGVGLVLRPGFEHPSLGALAALGSAICYATYQVLTRKVTGQADGLVLLFLATVVGAIAVTPLVPAVWVWPLPWQWAAMLSLGLMGTLGHFCLIKAYTYQDAPTLAPFMYVQLLFSTLYGWAIFGTLPDGLTLVGMIVILSSGGLVLWDARRKGKREEEAAAHPE